jgi:hypothetical protein
MPALPDVIIGRWETRAVFINGREVSPVGFVRDLKATELEPGDNQDIVKDCRWVRRFAWGDTSRSTYCLALACCFYLRIDWVMCRFFIPELQRLRQTGFRLEYDEETLQAAYAQCEEMFAREFTACMDTLGAIPVPRNVFPEDGENDDEF